MVKRYSAIFEIVNQTFSDLLLLIGRTKQCNERKMKRTLLSLKISTEWQLILFFAIIKLAIHLFTNTNYELHRDAYLYYAQSEHLAWGYLAAPPFIAVVGKFATLLFGNTIFGLRFFPAIIGAANMIIIGLMVKELGGKKHAILLASIAFILSPVFLHVNTMFQPVCFNQFFWLLSGYLILLLTKRNDPKIWIWIGILFGVAFLNKYSIVFFGFAFVVSLLLSQYRKLFISRYFLLGVGLGLVIIIPNLLWQYSHNWPVVYHMKELQETQLVHINIPDFLISQVLMNLQATILWIPALFILLFFKKERPYQLFGFIYMIVIITLILGHGKAYYSMGVYPIIFVFGAYFIEKYLHKHIRLIIVNIVTIMVVLFYVTMDYDGIPYYQFEQIRQKDAFAWEDGLKHDFPQDMADMTGWTEIAEKVNDVYLGLSSKEQENCDIFCYHYGQAGSIMFHGKKINIPQPISFNGSFVFWAPEEITKDYIIWVHSDLGNDIEPDSFLTENFQDVELKHVVDNSYFRENGTKIYFCKHPTEGLINYYSTKINERKDRYR